MRRPDMLKTKEILKLKHELQLSLEETAKPVNVVGLPLLKYLTKLKKPVSFGQSSLVTNNYYQCFTPTRK